MVTRRNTMVYKKYNIVLKLRQSLSHENFMRSLSRALLRALHQNQLSSLSLLSDVDEDSKNSVSPSS